MATNPYVNKVMKSDGTTIIDISDSTVTAETLAEGIRAYNAAGELITGSAIIPHIWGLEADFANSTFTRLESAVGLSGGSDFDSFKPWQRKRCNLADDGTINAYLGDVNYTEDGTNGQVMVEQPKFWYKIDISNYPTIKYYIADADIKGFELHPAFIGLDGNEKDFIYEAAYEGYVNSNMLFSISEVFPTRDFTFANAQTYAQNRGQNWKLYDMLMHSADQLLMIIEYGQFNMQDAIGLGFNVVNSTYIKTGTLSLYGNGSHGDKVNSTSAVQWRGKENPWGNIEEWVDGYKYTGYYPSVSKTHANTSYSTVHYQRINNSGYISRFGYSSSDRSLDWAFVPEACNGNSSLPVGDNAAGASNNNYDYNVTVAGQDNPYMGLFYQQPYKVGTSRYLTTIGARCIYIP